MKKISKILIVTSFVGLIGMSATHCASRVVYVRKAPPRARMDVRPAKPFSSAIWISGYWRWNGRQYIWITGKWAKPRYGKVWVNGHWKRTNRGWHYIPGHWR
jgi:hypothetical protein